MFRYGPVAALVTVCPEGSTGGETEFREYQLNKCEGDGIENLPAVLRSGRVVGKQLRDILRLQPNRKTVTAAQP